MDKMAAQLVSGRSEVKPVAVFEMCNCRLHWTTAYSNTLFGFRRALGRDYVLRRRRYLGLGVQFFHFANPRDRFRAWRLFFDVI